MKKMKIQFGLLNATSLFLLGFLMVAMLIPCASSAVEAPPERMTYQGYLVDGNGDRLGNSSQENHEVIFRIYAEQTGGSSIWAEQQTVTVDKGYFSVLLGEGTVVGSPIDLSEVFTGATASDRYIQITVVGLGPGNTDVDILPRLNLVSSPYAFMAANIAPEAVTSASIAPGTVTSSNIEDETLTASDLGVGSVGSSEVIDKSLTSLDIANNAIGTDQIADNHITSADIQNGTIAQADLGTVYSLKTVSGGANGVYVTSAGTVGIGNSNPASPIANGALRISKNGHVVVNNNYGLLAVNAAGTGIGAGVDSTATDQLDLIAGGVARVSVAPLGNVSIPYGSVSVPSGTLNVSSPYPNGVATLSVGAKSGYAHIFACYPASPANSSGYRFLVGQSITYIAGGVAVTSDARLKDDIKPLGSVMDRVMQLQPSTYMLKADSNKAEQVGVIAQDVLPVFPQLVSKPEGEDLYAVNYTGFGVIAIGAIQELNAQVETLEAEKSTLLERLELMEKRLDALEK